MQAGKGARTLGSHVILTLARGSAAPEGGGLQDREEAIVRAAEHVGRQQSNGSNGGFSGVSRRVFQGVVHVTGSSYCCSGR